MENQIHSVESDKRLNRKAVYAGIAAGALLLAAGVVEAKHYFDENFNPGQGIDEDMGISHGATASYDQLGQGFIHLQIQSLDIQHPHGDH